MNASLKILEEPPEYAITLLVVENPENLLETIRSRTVSLFKKSRKISRNEELRNAIEKYKNDDI
jgi:DNA polymerase III gamma/tau subunit